MRFDNVRRTERIYVNRANIVLDVVQAGKHMPPQFSQVSPHFLLTLGNFFR